MIARTPASIAELRHRPANGKNASEAITAPVEVDPGAAALSTAMRDRVHPAHLARADAGGGQPRATARSRSSARACTPPCEQQLAPLAPRSACASSTTSHLLALPRARCRGPAPACPPRTRFDVVLGDRRAPPLLVLEQPHVRLAAGDLERVLVVARARTPPRRTSAQLLGERAVDRPVEAEDAAEGALGVGGQRAVEGVVRPRADGRRRTGCCA